MIVKTKSLLEKDIKELYVLWNQEYPESLNFPKIEGFISYLNSLDTLSHIFIMAEDLTIKAWYFDFIREKEKWFGIVVNSLFQRRGYGSKLLDIAKNNNTTLNAWVVDNDYYIKSNGEPYESPLLFYEKNDFKVLTYERLDLEQISAVKIRWAER